MRKTRVLVSSSVLGILIVILAGAVVRASGSGLGCPHWPDCFEESFFPPLSAEGIPSHYDPEKVNLQKTWTEWINRLIGALAGLVILAAAITSWIELKTRRKIACLITAAGFLTAFQGWLGAKVVEFELDPRFVTVHLMLALVILFMLISSWLALRSRGLALPAGHPGLPSARRASRLLLAVALLQFLVGALVRGTIDLVAEENEQLARGDWVHEVGFIDYLHRGLGFALLLGVILVGLRLRALESPSRLFRRSLALGKILILLQVLVGLLLIEWDLEPAAQVIHIVAGSLLLALLYLQDRMLARHSGELPGH